MLNKKTLLACVFGGALLASSPVLAAQTLKLSHNQDRTHPVHKAMELMAKRTAELSNGNVKIRIYPNAELGNQRESLELVQNGSLAMAKSNAAELEPFSKAYGAYNMPYLFRDRDHFYKVLQSDVGREILRSSHDKGFIGLTYYDSGARSFYAKKAINSPDDLKGMKVRVQPSPSALAMVQALGASPTPLSYGELYTALQQGLIDAAENNLTALTLGRHGEVAKFFSEDEHTMIPDVLVISSKVWDGLSEADQKAVQQAADESMLEMKKLWEATEKEERAKAEKMGVTFTQPNKEPFRAAVKGMYDSLKTSDPEVYKLVETIQNIK